MPIVGPYIPLRRGSLEERMGYNDSAMMFGIVSKGKNIFIETANNNLNAVILFCGILLALAFAAKVGVTPLLDQFIPYPTMPIYH